MFLMHSVVSFIFNLKLFLGDRKIYPERDSKNNFILKIKLTKGSSKTIGTHKLQTRFYES